MLTSLLASTQFASTRDLETFRSSLMGLHLWHDDIHLLSRPRSGFSSNPASSCRRSSSNSSIGLRRALTDLANPPGHVLGMTHESRPPWSPWKARLSPPFPGTASARSADRFAQPDTLLLTGRRIPPLLPCLRQYPRPLYGSPEAPQ
jgi:hypothetical protein